SGFASVLSFSLFIFQGAVCCRLIALCVVRTRQLLYNTTLCHACQLLFSIFLKKVELPYKAAFYAVFAYV
ncbi:hypothetical protein, partial [Anaerotruncus colihominis]|uniref:hypothetical protein n=1 Tax=Anaerotruncus colihominis TaxID=169435 RepID=UPI0026EE13CB